MMTAAIQPQASQSPFEHGLQSMVQKTIEQASPLAQQYRKQAWARFNTLGMPNRRQETWKTIILRDILAQTYDVSPPAASLSEAALASCFLNAPSNDVLRLVFVNGHFAAEYSSVLDNAQPYTVSALSQLSAGQAEASLWELDWGAEYDAFSALTGALAQDGLYLDIPEQVQVKPLIHLLCITTAAGEAPQAAWMRHWVRVGAGASVQLLVQHVGLSQAHYSNFSRQDFHLEENAKAECTVLFDEGLQGWHFASSRSTLAEAAYLNLNTMTLQGYTLRHSVGTQLQGEHAHVQLNGLDVLNGHTQVFHPTVTAHSLPNAKSEQYYKGLLDGAGKSEFNGLVYVASGANGTDSQQLNKNLLLSPQAKVWTRPQLQINADDVKCAHGATVGQLEPEQLFYLASRGLNPALAQSLLTYGFAEEMVQRIQNPWVRKAVNSRLIVSLQHTKGGELKLKTVAGGV